MMEGLSKRRRRGVAVGILCVTGALFWSVLALPVITLSRDHAEWREATLESLARYRAIASHRAAFEAARVRLEANPIWQRLYDTDDSAAAAAQLQSDLAGLYDSQKLMTQMVQTLEPVTEAGVTRVGVRMAFTTTIDQLTTFLGALESAPKLMRTDDIHLTSPDYQEEGVNPTLSARMDVWAYLRPKAAQ